MQQAPGDLERLAIQLDPHETINFQIDPERCRPIHPHPPGRNQTPRPVAPHPVVLCEQAVQVHGGISRRIAGACQPAGDTNGLGGFSVGNRDGPCRLGRLKNPLIFLNGAWLAVALASSAPAQIVINELVATNSDRLLVRESGQYPRVGNTQPWQRADYDDSQWNLGLGPFGFGSFSGVTLGTNVAAEMQNRTAGLYLRKRFTASEAQSASGLALLLAVDYNDGFIAFLNGVEIARRNMGRAGMFAYRDQTAFNARAGGLVETVNLGPAGSGLVAGENVLCIQVHNQSLVGVNAPNLLLKAELRINGGAILVTNTDSWRYFAGHSEPSGGLIDYGLLREQEQAGAQVAWAAAGFNDSAWGSGVGPVGIERNAAVHYLLGVNLQAQTYNITPSIYIRNAFDASAAEADSAFPLSVTIDYDDGLIVFINGKEAFRRNMGAVGTRVAHETPATGSRNANGDNGNVTGQDENFNLAAANSWLVAGNNVMGIQLHRSSLTSSDSIARVTLRTTGPSPRTLLEPTDPVRYFVGTEEPVIEGEEEDDSADGQANIDSENDWVELHNTSAAEVSMDGWSLGDNLADPRQWTFPNGVTIPAGGYLVVMATGLTLTPEDGATYLHTNFRLSAAGENVVLTRPDNVIGDSLSPGYPPQIPRYSYGRDGDGNFGYLAMATPGQANSATALGQAPALPQFSVAGGFHPGTINLALTTSTPGASIRYTINGSDPANGVVYSSPITVNSNRVVRARTVLAGAIPSETVTHTYMINEAAARQSLAAICLGGDPVLTYYGPNTSGGPANGEGIFSIAGGTYSGDVWNSAGSTSAFHYPMQRGRSAEKPATLEYLPLSGEPLRTEVGLRISGSPYSRPRYVLTNPANTRFDPSNATQKPSFNVFFRSEFGERPLDYPFIPESAVTRFKDIRVRAGKNDISNPFIRDELMRRIFAGTGQKGSVGTFNTLWINGVYKGYYNITERLREGFMQEHHQSGAAWDVQQVNEFSSGDPVHWNQMMVFLRTTNFNNVSNYPKVHDYLDVDNFIDYLLVNAFAAMWDWPHNNWVAARERSPAGRWRFYMWDAEGGLGMANRDTNYNTFTSDLIIGDAMTTNTRYIHAIYTLLRNAPEFRMRFADRAQKQMFNEGALVNSRMTAIFNQLRGEINPIMQHTIGQAVNSGFYNTWIASSTRRNVLFTQLRGQGHWPSTQAPVLSKHGGQIAAGDQLSISNPNAQGIIYLTLDGSDPRAPGGAVAGPAYSGPVTMNDTTRVRARVLASGVWSPEVDVVLAIPFSHPTFMPSGSGDWTINGSWSSGPAPYPNGAGTVAAIPGAAAGDRNVNLRAPVTVGRILFDQGGTAFRNRVRDQDSGNNLTFSNFGESAEIEVTGTGAGLVEFEVAAGSVLVDSMVLDISNVVGDPEHGALRLRSGWSGPGGLIKTGLGIASFTGEGKNYGGVTLIAEGVLQVTEPATPAQSGLVTVEPGGQLRLVSGSFGQPRRVYAFGGPIRLSGFGRGDEIPDSSQMGKAGALSYHPGGTANHAVVAGPVELIGPAGIHVDGSGNRLEIAGALSGGHLVRKTGGGTLVLAGDQAAHSPLLQIENGGLEIHGASGSSVELWPSGTLTGFGETGPIGGEGSIVLVQTRLRSPSGSAGRYAFVFGEKGGPSYENASDAGNALHLLEVAPGGLLELEIYLTGPTPLEGDVYLGGFAVPYGQDLAGSLAFADIRVFAPDPAGPHLFDDGRWSPVPSWRLATVARTQPLAPPFAEARMLELTIGSAVAVKFSHWQQATFTNPADLADPMISGPEAEPFGDGLANVIRYALGVPAGETASAHLPSLAGGAAGYGLEFPFDSRRADVAVVVEASVDLADWSSVIYDSRVDFPPPADGNGRVIIVDPRGTDGNCFYRLRVDLNE